MISISTFRAALAAAAVLLAVPGGALGDEIAVAATTIPEFKAVFGRVESRDVVAARARIGGTVSEIRVDEGSQVESGDVIAVVVDDKIALEREAAEAEIKALRSQLDNAETDLNRAKQLLASGTATQSRVDQATTLVGVLTNQLSAAEARRAVIAQQSTEGEVVAPASGRVLTVPVTRGSVILPGETLATIAGGGYFLRLALPERHAQEIAEGDKVLVGRRALAPTPADDMTTFREGTLAKVYPAIEGGRVLADVEVDGLGDYFVGERTLVWIPVGSRPAIVVPTRAVTTRHGVDYVRILQDDTETEVAVILGGEIAGDDGAATVEVLTGLVEGDRVVLP
jgi:RND family efflux transporter MFP subunit